MIVSASRTHCQSPATVFVASEQHTATVQAALRRLRFAYLALPVGARPDLRSLDNAVMLLDAGDVLVLAFAGRFPVRGKDLETVVSPPKTKRRSRRRQPRIRKYIGCEM